nr:hypothetical protein [Tanacetum cinerariifolium]
DSSDDQSLSDEDVLEKIYSNPLFDEEIIPIEIDQHSFNAECDLIESMPNHDIILPKKLFIMRMNRVARVFMTIAATLGCGASVILGRDPVLGIIIYGSGRDPVLGIIIYGSGRDPVLGTIVSGLGRDTIGRHVPPV